MRSASREVGIEGENSESSIIRSRPDLSGFSRGTGLLSEAYNFGLRVIRGEIQKGCVRLAHRLLLLCRLVVTDPTNFLEARFWPTSGFPADLELQEIRELSSSASDIQMG